VRVTINGDPRDVSDGTTVATLVHQLQLNERRIAVEVNREIVARELYAAHALAEGDEIEIVHFVGGG
jgi:sulfur carrier protein